MTRLLWDENTSHHILRGLRRRRPALDIVTVQQLGLTGADDHAVLDRAVADGRVLVTQDRSTMPAHVVARRQVGQPIPGIVIVLMDRVSLRTIIDDLLFVIDAAEPGDWQNPLFIP